MAKNTSNDTAGRPETPQIPSHAQIPGHAQIIDWHAGIPVYQHTQSSAPAVATPAPQWAGWLIKPGDLICDWLKVEDADSRGLLRLFANLTLYAKISVAIAFLLS